MNKSENIGSLAAALAKSQSQFKPVKRSVKVDFTAKSGARVKYNYAPLSDVLDSCIKTLNDNELVVIQPTHIEDNKIIVETMLIHSSGEWISGELCIVPSDHNPQSEGSALSYARRYSLSSLLSIATDEDDDAESAMNREAKETKKDSPVLQAAKTAGAVEKKTETPGNLATEAQLRAIFAIQTKRGITDTLSQHEYVAQVLGMEKVPATLKTLTKAQASQVIESLQ